MSQSSARTPAAESIWSDRDFVLYWAGNAVSIAGSAITTVVLPLLVYQITESAFLAGFFFMVQTLGYFAFALFGGVLADSLDRRRLLIGCNVLSAVLVGSIPLANTFGLLALPHLFVVGCLIAVTVSTSSAAAMGAVVSLVGRDRILTANSALGSAESATGLVGPAIGGALAITIGPANTIALDAISYLVAAGSIVLIGRSFGGGQVPGKGRLTVRRVFSDIGEGLRFVFEQPIVRVLALINCFNTFTTGIVLGLLVVYGVRALDLDVGDSRIGLLYTAVGAGALLGNLTLPRLGARLPAGWITLLAAAFGVTSMVGLAIAPIFVAGLVVIMTWSMARTFALVNSLSLRQRVTPDHLMGRVGNAARTLSIAGQPLGALAGGIIAEALSVRAAFVLAALVFSIAFLFAFRSPLRFGHVEAAG